MQAQRRPKLTAILFTYNHKDSIARCIESLVFQKTGYSYEVHIWDDCSIDGTSDICRRYAAEHPDKIVLHIQPKNTFLNDYLEMQSFAAISSIKTEYFCCIDGDDYWCDENKVQVALDFLENHPEYVGFAHDTLIVDKVKGFSKSYCRTLLNLNIENPVTLKPGVPFFLTSSRVFRTCDYVKKKILPIDYVLYYYHLSLGPVYYHDKVMAAYVIGENSTFAILADTHNLNGMFPYKLAKLFDFQHDEFCTELLKAHDASHGLGTMRYDMLNLFKRFLGKRLGWHVWFYLTFVPRYGLECTSINYVYSRSRAKKHSDTLAKSKESGTN